MTANRQRRDLLAVGPATGVHSRHSDQDGLIAARAAACFTIRFTGNGKIRHKYLLRLDVQDSACAPDFRPQTSGRFQSVTTSQDLPAKRSPATRKDFFLICGGY